MNKKSLTETDIRSKFITPALCGQGGAGWDLMTQVREEAFFTKGRVIVRGKTVLRTTPDRDQSGATDGLGGRVGNATHQFA
jgi:type I restriction enzyme R subunit